MRHGSTLLAVMAACLVTSVAAADDVNELPNSMLGVRVSPILLLSRADVRAVLNLSEEQTVSAERAIGRIYAQAASLKGKPNDAEASKARRAIDDEAITWITTRLTPEQKARLVEVDLQWEGPSALISRPVIVRELHLDHEQIRKLKAAILRHAKLRKKNHAAADEVLAEVALSTLNVNQRETWKAMMGSPIAFKKRQT